MGFEISITAPPPEEKMSASEIRKYGIKEIPLSDVKEWGTKRGLSQETIEEIMKGGKTSIYRSYTAWRGNFGASMEF